MKSSRIFARTALVLLSLTLASAAATPAWATRLIFQQDTGVLASPIPESYGDAVAGFPQQGSFLYGSEGGATPNVNVSYKAPYTLPVFGDDTLLAWQSGYGDLEYVAYMLHGEAYITLTADPGYAVSLHSFDMGGYFQSDKHLLFGFIVRNGATNGILYQSAAPLAIAGAGPSHSSFTFSSPLTAPKIVIELLHNQINQDVGIDNIVFSQGVPEPSSLIIAAMGLVSLALIARRRRGR